MALGRASNADGTFSLFCAKLRGKSQQQGAQFAFFTCLNFSSEGLHTCKPHNPTRRRSAPMHEMFKRFLQAHWKGLSHTFPQTPTTHSPPHLQPLHYAAAGTMEAFKEHSLEEKSLLFLL